MRQEPHGHPMLSIFENPWNMRQEEGEAVYRALRILGGDGTGCLWSPWSVEVSSAGEAVTAAAAPGSSGLGSGWRTRGGRRWIRIRILHRRLPLPLLQVAVHPGRTP